MAPSTETTPLLDDPQHPHAALFDSLDQQYPCDSIHDHPECPKRYAVKKNLIFCTNPSGYGHPIHHQLQSPALVLRIQQALELGFKNVYTAVRSFFKSFRTSPDPTTLDSYFTVTVVFVVAVLTMVTMTSVSPSLLLYMNHVSFTTPSNISPYVTSSALQSAVPIASNVLLGRVASSIGPGRALAVGAFTAASGLLIMTLARTSLFMFFIGYSMYAASNSLRVIRVSILTKVVPPKERTTVLATHALMTPVGALIGPLLWIFFSTYRGNFHLGPLTVDRFSLAYLTAGASMMAITIVSVTMLVRIVTFGGSSDGGDSQEYLGQVTIRREDGREEIVDLQAYRNKVFMYFCGIMLGVNMSAGVFMTAFQPVLVNVFHTSDAKLGLIFEVIAAFAVIPPMLVALLSKYLMDRQIMLIGLCSKLVGMMLFLPLFGRVREWQVIAGFILIIKASIFFSTASMSVFTKVLGSMSTSMLLGLLSSGSSVGPAVAQILLSRHIVELFGSFWFACFAIPAGASLGLIVWPKFWKRLDPGREFTQLVTHEAEVTRSRNGNGII